jgi:hypothetical protein
MEMVASMIPENGLRLTNVEPSLDNRVVVLEVTDSVDQAGNPETPLTLLLDGEVIAKGDEHLPTDAEDIMVRISFDGTKVAVVRPHLKNTRVVWEISINGKVLWEMPYETLYDIQWISNDDLAWVCMNNWYEDDDWRRHVDNIHFFVNGVNRTETFEFISVAPRRDGEILVVMEGDQEWDVFDDGHQSDPRPRRKNRNAPDIHDSPKPEVAKEKLGPTEKTTQVCFLGEDGPLFHGIKPNGVVGNFTYTEDRSRVGYIGFRYFRWLFKFYSWAEKQVDRHEDKDPVWMIPLVFLVSPYFLGPLLEVVSKRHYPVNGTKEWKKGYMIADDPFFTPAGELVITVTNKHGKQFVVTEEREGPIFDKIRNLRYLKDEGVLCYIGQRKDGFYRVTVNC